MNAAHQLGRTVGRAAACRALSVSRASVPASSSQQAGDYDPSAAGPTPCPDGRWAAEITVGYDERGRQQKSRVYGKTQAAAREKLDELKARLEQGSRRSRNARPLPNS